MEIPLYVFTRRVFRLSYFYREQRCISFIRPISVGVS